MPCHYLCSEISQNWLPQPNIFHHVGKGPSVAGLCGLSDGEELVLSEVWTGAYHFPGVVCLDLAVYMYRKVTPSPR